MSFKNKINFINAVLDFFNNDYNKSRGYIIRCYHKCEISGSEEIELLDLLYKFNSNGWLR